MIEQLQPAIEYASVPENWWIIGPSIFLLISLGLAVFGQIVVYEDIPDMALSFLPVAVPVSIGVLLYLYGIGDWSVWKWPLVIFEVVILSFLLIKCFTSNEGVVRTLFAYPLKVLFGAATMCAIFYVFDDDSRSDRRAKSIVLIPFLLLMFVLVNGGRARWR